MDDLESRLRGRLGRDAELGVPPDIDAAVLGAGRAAARGFARRRRLRLVASLAAAAALLVAGTWLAVRAAGGDREFDVVDAWRVAAGIEVDARFDLDGDGRVGRADADAMLTRIVALGPGRRS